MQSHSLNLHGQLASWVSWLIFSLTTSNPVHVLCKIVLASRESSGEIDRVHRFVVMSLPWLIVCKISTKFS